MKKFLITIALCFIFAGCVSVEPQIDPDLVKMEITAVTDKSVTFEIQNNSKDNIVFGNEYRIEYKDGDSWVEITERTETFFTEIAYVLESGNSKCFTENFEYRYGILSSGTYRVIKDIRFETEDGIDFGGQRIFAEFEVISIER